MPRYVILEHDHPHLHWDLMLETGNVLRTWRLEKPPQPDEPIEARALGDHRLAYLEYEGPLTNNRGTVKRWDVGVYESEAQSGKVVKVRLSGLRLNGNLEMEQRGTDQWEARYFPNP